MKRLLFVLLMMAGIDTAVAQIPGSERAVLINLYNSTNGPGWTNQTNWNGPVGSECAWYGITCAGDTVTRILLPVNQLTGSIPNLTGLTNLQHLSLSANQLSGSIPDLTGLTNLQDLDLQYNQLTGSIPEFTGLTNLQRIALNINRLTGSIPDLTGLTNLGQLHLHENQLTGSIPDLAGLTNLRSVDLRDNQLTGSIPEVTGLTNLQQLALHTNQLTGSIPDLTGLTNLELLWLSENQLSGSIPHLAGLTNLVYLYLYSNQLSGSIPELSGLTNLQRLILDNNQLNGSIPDLSGLTNLERITVQNNQLTGPVPAAPSSLVPGWSSLCPNYLTPSVDPAWDAATFGVTPWYAACTAPPSTIDTYTVPFIPFSSVYYISEADGSGDRLVVGTPAGDLPQLLQLIPAPNSVNEVFSDPVQLSPSLAATAYVPTAGERSGDFSAFAGVLIDPASGQPFAGGLIPANRFTDVFAWRIRAVSNPVAVAPENPVITTVRGSGPTQQQIRINGQGTEPVTFTVSATTRSLPGWLSVDVTGGTVAFGQTVTTNATLDPTGLEPGTYEGEIVVESADPALRITVPVSFSVSARAQALRISQSGFTFSSSVGEAEQLTHTIRILNDGTGTLNWTLTASTLSGGNWLAASPTQGSADAATGAEAEIVVDTTGLATGVYYGLVEVSAPEAANSPQTVTVVLQVLPAEAVIGPRIDPLGVIFVYDQGSPLPAAEIVQVSNPGSATITYSATPVTEGEIAWLSATPESGSILADGLVDLEIQVAPATLAAGVYSGQIQLNFGNGVVDVVEVRIIVIGSSQQANPVRTAASGCQKTSLVPVFRLFGSGLSLPAGWPAAIEVSVYDNCGEGLAEGQVYVAFDNIISPQLLLGRAAPGLWTGTWSAPPLQDSTAVIATAEARDPSGIAGRATRNLQIHPNPESPPRVAPGGVVHSASFVPSPLAPGTIVSIFGSGLASEALDGGQSAPSLPLPFELGQAEVALGGVPLPLLYSRADQLNAIIPFALQERVNERLPLLIVRTEDQSVSVSEPVVISPARPGIFTQDSSGKGRGAILDAGYQLVTAGHPVSPGDIIAIYCAGLGAVDPNVSVADAAPVDPLAWITQPIVVTVGGVEARLHYFGLAPSFAGLYQVNAEIPQSVPAGETEVRIRIGDQESRPVVIDVTAGN